MSSTALGDKLARDARGGDQRALAKIFSDYHQPLYRYCLAIVGDRQDAEDALQETMIKVLRSLPGEKREIALRPWLYRIAHNESIDQLRRRPKNVSLEDSEPAAVAGLAEQVEVRERLRQLISDLGMLPERQRGALLLREAAGLDFDEIAAALDTTPAVARQTLYEARLGLREMDAGREMDCTAVTKALSDGDRRVRRRRDMRAHLRDCAGCRAFAEEIDNRRADLAAIAPLPAVMAATLLHGVLGSGASAGAGVAGGTGVAGMTGGSGGAGVGAGASAAGKAGAAGAGGIGALAAGTATKSIGTASLLKGAAAVAVVALIGVGAADKSGLIGSGGHHPAPLLRSSSSVRPDEGDPGPADTEGENIGGAEAGVGSVSRAKVARARARHRLGPAGAARPQERSEAEGAGPTPTNRESREAGKPNPPDTTHGQETAAGNHAAHEAKEIPSSKGAGEHPVHPTHPDKPVKPVKEAKTPPAPAAEHAANSAGKGK
jgi:RNA polymerase sigma factor (sigma-70 family)